MSRQLLNAASMPAVAIASSAFAKPAHVATSPATELRALREQVKILTARPDAQEASTLQTQSATRDVQAQAAQVTAQTVPTQVKTALAASAPKATPAAWYSDTVISGCMYFNASNINEQLNGAKTNSIGTGFNIKRFYLGIDHKFDKTFSANLTMDVSNVVGRTAFGNFAGNSIGVVPPATPCSVFGSVNFAPHFSAFGRSDHETPRKEALPHLNSDYFNVGVQYSPVKIVDLALVYKRDKVMVGQMATQNGVIGVTSLNNEYL